MVDRYREHLVEHLADTAQRSGLPPSLGRTAFVVHEGLVWSATALAPEQLRAEARQLAVSLAGQSLG